MGLQASILLNLLSLRFKQPAVVKANKFGQVIVVHVYPFDSSSPQAQLNQNLRNFRSKAASVLKDVSADLTKVSADESTSDQRRAFADACKSLQEFNQVRSANASGVAALTDWLQFEHDSLIDVAKKLGDARKRVIEGVGKCLSKSASSLS